MRAISILLMVVCLLACSLTAVSAKQLDCCVPREHHPWGQFKVGSWKRVRTQTETLGEDGRVTATTTTETTTKLVDVDDSGYMLRIDVVVEVAGKRFTSEPQVVRRGFSGEAEGQMVSVKDIGEGTVTVNGTKVPCEVRQITLDENGSKRITTVHYSKKVSPHVLRRETTSLGADGKPLELQSQVDVVAIDMPYRVLDQIRSTSHTRIMHQQGKASTMTLEVHCADIPGGVVAHTSKETDDSGRVIRRSTLELQAFELGTGEDADTKLVRKVFHRGRTRRTR